MVPSIINIQTTKDRRPSPLIEVHYSFDLGYVACNHSMYLTKVEILHSSLYARIQPSLSIKFCELLVAIISIRVSVDPVICVGF